MGKCFLMIYFI